MVADQPLRQSLLAQARLRLGLGMPALLFVVGAVYFFDAAEQQIGAHAMAGLSGAYILYCMVAFLWALRNRGRWDNVLLGATIVGDPFMLSAFLYGTGNGAIVFVGFYLFTILGFGFRVGITSMRLCQAAAIIGFAFVAFFSPVWRQMPMVAASHLTLLVAVPLYASALIRSLREAQKAAQYESEAKSRLLANVSHELRTPLTGIISAAQLIEAETRGGDVIAAKARSIADMAWHLDGEISQLLDLSKLQISAPTDDEVVSFTMDSLISNVLDAVQTSAVSKNLALSARIDPAITVPVKGMAQPLRSVLINLLGNAIKFTESGRVEVSVDVLETGNTHYLARFTVSDTGIGMQPEHLGRIFEPFYQVERGANRKYGGTGLGMAISREHVSRLGGRIQVKSTPGEGSVFWFDIALEKSHAANLTQEQEAGAKSIRPKRVLLADDNATNLALIREMLTKEGHEVVAVMSGADAVSRLANDEFDLLMLDYNMHDIDGARVWSVYSMGTTHPAPTFFITADTTAKTREHLLSLGVSGVIYKPITFTTLRKSLLKVFPDDAVPLPESKPRPPPQPQLSVVNPAGRLSTVAVEYLAPDVLANLAEINPSTAFATSLLGDARNDIVQISQEMSTALSRGDLPAMRRHGHALKGVSLNLGAPRLAAFGERMMSTSYEAAQAASRDLEDSLKEEVAQTIGAIDALLAQLATKGCSAPGVGAGAART